MQIPGKKVTAWGITLLMVVAVLVVHPWKVLAVGDMGKAGYLPAFSLGGLHSAAISASGDLYTWGSNYEGQLGHGDKTDRHIPTKISDLSDVIGVSLGGTHSAALTANGDLYTWGNNGSGRLGIGHATYRHNPTKVSDLSDVIAVSLGHNHSAALTANGDLYTWGDNIKGQLGHGDTTDRHIPTKVSDLSDVIAVSLGYEYSAIVTANGDLFTWGGNHSGRLGHGDTTNRHIPTKVSDLSDVIAVSLGGFHSAALTSNGDLYTWGNNINGQLGHGDTSTRHIPTRVSNLSDVIEVSLGFYHNAVLTANGDLYTWGRNSQGELGHGGTTDKHIPTKVSNLSDVIAVSLGESHIAVFTTNGNFYTWGSNLYGQLGHGDTISKYVPTYVYGIPGYSSSAPTPTPSPTPTPTFTPTPTPTPTPTAPLPTPPAVGYGQNERFLAQIDPPDANSIPISTMEDINNIRNDLNGKYHLTADIDMLGADWVPIGSGTASAFTGTFDGQGYAIRDFTAAQGLFGYAVDAVIKNIGLEYVKINGNGRGTYMGGVCGYNLNSTIYNCYNSGGSITSSSRYTGGICAYIDGYGSISGSYNNSAITVNFYDERDNNTFVGGICGYNGIIANCFNAGSIDAGGYDIFAGGICGSGPNGNISKCYNTGSVSTRVNNPARYVSGISTAGGICGTNGTITDCYNTGVVYAYASFNSMWSSVAYAGGILGSYGNVFNSYNTGSIESRTINVMQPNDNYGLAGSIYGLNIHSFSNLYWNIDSPQTHNGFKRLNVDKRGGGSSNYGTVPLTTAQMIDVSNFDGFDFTNIWDISSDINDGYPHLRVFHGSAPITPIPTPTPTPDNIESFVKRIYTNVLERESDIDGFDFWVNGLKNGDENAESIIDSFVFGPEFISRNVTNEQFIKIAYNTLLDREPDTNFWVETLEKGFNRRYVTDKFLMSEEFTAICADYEITVGPVAGLEGFVARMYRNVLCRRYDTPGLTWWVDALQSGHENAASIAYHFFLSEELLARGISNEAYVDIAYKTLMNRDPDAIDLAYWLDELINGTAHKVLLDFIMLSSEFKEICDDYRINTGLEYNEQAAVDIAEDKEIIIEEIGADETTEEETEPEETKMEAGEKEPEQGGPDYWADLPENETDHNHALNEMIADNEYREIYDKLGLPNHK